MGSANAHVVGKNIAKTLPDVTTACRHACVPSANRLQPLYTCGFGQYAGIGDCTVPAAPPIAPLSFLLLPPDRKIVFTTLLWNARPQLYPLRGDVFRDPREWIAGFFSGTKR